MTSDMKDDSPNNPESGALFNVLKAHYRALVAARSDKTILRQYASLLRALKSKSSSFLEARRHADAARPVRSRSLPTIDDDALRKASLSDLERIVTDAGTARKVLEFIATQRFSVPSGSMRSFSNREMLVDKLRTLIGNERTHETISAVAREQERR